MKTHEEVLQDLIADLRAGIRPWIQPWGTGPRTELPRNFATDHRYRGINVLILWNAARRRKFTRHLWIGEKQADAKAGGIKAGAEGTRILVHVFPKPQKENAEQPASPIQANDHMPPPKSLVLNKEWEPHPYFVARTVFNIDQVIDPPAHLLTVPNCSPGKLRHGQAEHLMRSTGADIRYKGQRAVYYPAEDYIALPPFENFTTRDDFYATAFHELVHWTGHESRLARRTLSQQDRRSYAMEELVAELGAAFLCAEYQLNPIASSSDYLGSWLKEIEEEGLYALIRQATSATKATDLLHGRNQEKAEQAPTAKVQSSSPPHRPRTPPDRRPSSPQAAML